MPTTRAARRAAAERQLLELPADVLGLVLYQLPLAHDIALTGLTCRALCDAAKLALKLRSFSGEVVTLAGHNATVTCVAATPDGRIITGSYDTTVKVWRDGACERTINAHHDDIEGVALLPGGARFVACADDGTAKLWTSTALSSAPSSGHHVHCVAALPDGVHFVVGLAAQSGCTTSTGRSSTPSRGTPRVSAMAVTLDGQHIISGAYDELVKVWSVATKSLVSTCHGHTGGVYALAAMPDGQRFLSGGGDEAVRVWLLNGTLANTFKLHTEAVNALVALPDNQHALSGSFGTVELFNVNDSAALRTFEHHTSKVTSPALLPDGLRFASGSEDKTCITYHGLALQ